MSPMTTRMSLETRTLAVKTPRLSFMQGVMRLVFRVMKLKEAGMSLIDPVMRHMHDGQEPHGRLS
jgi:hypothetical protein